MYTSIAKEGIGCDWSEPVSYRECWTVKKVPSTTDGRLCCCDLCRANEQGSPLIIIQSYLKYYNINFIRFQEGMTNSSGRKEKRKTL